MKIRAIALCVVLVFGLSACSSSSTQSQSEPPPDGAKSIGKPKGPGGPPPGAPARGSL